MTQTLKSSSKLSLAVAISRVLGLVRVSLFSRLFGVGATADAFTVAFRIPNLLRDLLAEGALSSAFIPTFIQTLTSEGKQSAYALANIVFSGLLMLTGALTLAGIIFTEPLVFAITEGWSAEKVELTVRLTQIMMPLLSFFSLGAVWMGMLNAQQKFFLPACAPSLFNLLSIFVGLGLYFGPDLDILRVVEFWSMGTLLAGFVQFLSQLPLLWKLGFRPALKFRGLFHHPGVRRIARLMLPAVLGLTAVQINVLVNTHFASDLGDGPVAQLEYAFRIFFLPVGIFGVALGTVTTTHVSEQAARGNREALISQTAESTLAVWMLTSASAVGLIVLAEPVVSLLFEGAQFTRADTLAVVPVLRAFLLGLIPYSMVKVIAPTFYSLNKPRIPLLASILAVVVNISFNAWTYHKLGPTGLAFGTSLGAMVNFVVLRIAFYRRVGPFQQAGRGRNLLWLIGANLTLAVVVGIAWKGGFWLLHQGVSNFSSLAFLLRLSHLCLLFCPIFLGFFAYVGLLKQADFPGASLLWSLPGKLWTRVFKRSR